MIKAFRHDDDVDELICNTYVVGRRGKPCIVIDMGDKTDNVENYIKANNTKVLGLLLTHAHFDHIRGVKHFLNSFDYSIPVYLEEEDYEMLMTDSMNGAEEEHEKLNIDFDPVLVKDEQVLTFGELKIKVIHTPFHTQGSSCFLSEEDNALFTGDTLFKGSIGRTDFQGGDAQEVFPSLMKLKALSDLLVCYPGHGGITKLGEEKKNNPFFR
ncbi:MAG: MBL fold metallo-hydrolase [Bacilli bacterium]|jgi:glyoxylase-like metal-dependent hydrolase (beta-lactamase superfamily II)|nr:MBL fold metallo-hydrolase [Bacilli bacterium]